MHQRHTARPQTPPRRRVAAGRNGGRKKAAAASNRRLRPYAYVLEDNQPAFVLVPVDVFEGWAAEKGARTTGNRAWMDADDFALEVAGQQIAAARKRARLTQKQLADRLGVPQSQVSRIERNPDHTTVRTLKRLARALGVNVAFLIN
jgi:DNA-binding XRE family transcriptional regulator